MMMKTMTGLLLAALCTGCIMPIPHRRVHSYGVEGRVCDASTSSPIVGAVVTSNDQKHRETKTNDKGEFSLRPAYGWHGAYVIGPISLSLLPCWDITFPGTAIDVTATGYQSEHFRVVDIKGTHKGTRLKAGDLCLKPIGTDTNALPTTPRTLP